MDIRDNRGAPASGARTPFEEMALFPFAAPWAEFMSKAFQPLAMPFSPPSVGGAGAPLPATSAMAFSGPLGEYLTDCTQRTILFWDVLRRRSQEYYAHKEKSLPSVLMFDADVILDGRTFARPVNYILVKIRPPEGVVLNAKKRPFVVVDPRAGHGPGIGGFKADSELGVAMRAGHTCYFVGFYPEPVAGQTIEDIMHAEALFLEKIHELHPDAEGKPCVIGAHSG